MKTILITGASGGIGSAAAKKFAAPDQHILLHANRNVSQAEDVCRFIRQQGGKADVITADFTRSDAADILLQKAAELTDRADILINAAGIDLMAPDIAGGTFEQKLQTVLQTDVFVPVCLSKKIGAKMQSQYRGTPHRGVIFFLGWNGVQHGWRGDTAQLYGIAKGALLGFCQSLAEDLAPEVLIRSLSLGWIQTRWGGTVNETVKERYAADSLQNRWGTPEEVAEAMLFLSQESSAFIDGIGLPIDGGKRGTKFECSAKNMHR